MDAVIITPRCAAWRRGPRRERRRMVVCVDGSLFGFFCNRPTVEMGAIFRVILPASGRLPGSRMCAVLYFTRSDAPHGDAVPGASGTRRFCRVILPASAWPLLMVRSARCDAPHGDAVDVLSITRWWYARRGPESPLGSDACWSDPYIGSALA